MAIPRMPNVKSKPKNEPKLAGIKEMTSLFIEKIPAVRVIGVIYNCGVIKTVRNLFLSSYLVTIGLPS